VTIVHLRLVMAVLGAPVTTNDISKMNGEIVAKINASILLENPTHFVQADFLKIDFTADTLDIIGGNAFVHHLTYYREAAFYKK